MGADPLLTFVPTEYTSQNGHGTTVIRRTSRGWVVTLWRHGSGEHALAPEPTIEAAVAAYAALCSAPDNDVEW